MISVSEPDSGLSRLPDSGAASAPAPGGGGRGSRPRLRPARHRRRYTDEAFLYIPKLFILVDRNPYSATFGCFDRQYWHYRTMDFPCGMSQEFALPLALVYAREYPGNPWFRKERVKDLALAGVDFAARSAHPNGGCDDYFPYEQALGAGVFTLYALSETLLTLENREESRLRFLERRADWLLNYQETGRLTNHQALCALALYNVFLITGGERFRRGAWKRVEICREWFHPEEGWFDEYEGADPGYQSCTIDFLAKLWKKSGDARLLELLAPAARFAWHFMSPDGAYGGEYGSRNTYHFYPHGFELLAPHVPEAAQIADHFTRVSLPRRRRYYNDDDRMCAHYLYDWLQAFEDFHPGPVAPLAGRAPFRRYFAGAKLLVVNTPHYYAVANLSKGGVWKAFDARGPIRSDTGLIAREAGPRGRTLVSHLVDSRNRVEVDANLRRARVEGAMCLRRAMLPTPAKQIVFRLINLTLGRFAPNLLRALLQKKLIVGKPRTDYRFAREIEFGEEGITVRDELRRPPDAPRIASVHAGSDATSIYVANSNVYQESVLLPWRSLGRGFLRRLNESGQARATLRLRLTARRTNPRGAQSSSGDPAPC